MEQSDIVKEEPTDPMREFVRELTDHQPALRAFVSFLMAGSSGFADAVQEVNLLLWEKRGQFRPGSNFRAWAFTTARFVVMGYHRRMRRDYVLVFDADLIEQLADEWEAEPDEHEKKLAVLERCLAQLPDDDAELVRLRYGGHGDVERFAATAGKSAGSLRLRLFRLRAALKQCVQRGIGMEGGFP